VGHQQAGPIARHAPGPHLEVGTMKQVHSSHGIESETARLGEAEARHRALDERLRELGRHVYLTPEEQIEVAQLKKQKLKTKDEIQEMRRASS
jgi:uncharacterized protein YdcH (DUF465 family)